MIVGTEVQSADCPGATGTVIERRDSDDGVVLRVAWVTATGRSCASWHRESSLVYAGTETAAD